MKIAYEIFYKLLIISIGAFAVLSFLGVPLGMLVLLEIISAPIVKIWLIMLGSSCLSVYFSIICLFFIYTVREDRWKSN